MNTIAPISRSITQTNLAFKPRTPRDTPRLGKGAAVDVTKHPYNGMDRSCAATIYPMLDKPRTTGAFQDRRKIEPLLRPA
jgi:hypothetical protein